MGEKKSDAKKNTDKKSAKVEIKQKIVSSALALAVEQGWQYVTLQDIATRSGVSLTDLYDCVDHRDDILVLLGRMIDKKVLENVHYSDDDTTSARERVFDILMDRYDILNDHREGIIAILDSFMCDPKQVIISMPHLCRSMSWMLETSGIETSGIKGAIKVTGMTGIYLKVLRTWKSDESKDLSKTMAALDKSLDRAEGIANSFGF